MSTLRTFLSGLVTAAGGHTVSLCKSALGAWRLSVDAAGPSPDGAHAASALASWWLVGVFCRINACPNCFACKVVFSHALAFSLGALGGVEAFALAQVATTGLWVSVVPLPPRA